MEKEQHIQETLIRNQQMMEEKKNKLLNDIKKHEENTNKEKRKKRIQKEKMQEESYHQRLEKESRLKEIFREQENRREEIRQWLDDKKQGQGIYIYLNGDKIVGNYNGGKPVGTHFKYAKNGGVFQINYPKA